MNLEKIQQEFKQLDDKHDIFDFIMLLDDVSLHTYLYTIKEYTEYGATIDSYTSNGLKYGPSVHVSYGNDFSEYSPEETCAVSSYLYYYNNKECYGLGEKIFSNRIEWYSGLTNYICTNNNNSEIDDILKYINMKLLGDKVYHWLYELIKERVEIPAKPEIAYIGYIKADNTIGTSSYTTIRKYKIYEPQIIMTPIESLKNELEPTI